MTRAHPLLVAALAVALMSLLAVAQTPSAAAHASPSLSTFSIQTSAPPDGFVGFNETYVIQASVPVNNWTILAGHSLSISYVPGSQQATMHLFNASAGTDAVHVEAQASGYAPAYQNWTLTTFALPFIYSLPAFNVVDGGFYNYSVSGSEVGNYTFVGAPYLAAHNYSGHWVVSGPVQSGTFTNSLTLRTTGGNFTQYWVTSDGTTPANLSLVCFVGDHQVAATMPVGSVGIGCGRQGVFEGEYPIFSVVYPSAVMGFTLGDNAEGQYTAYLSAPVPSYEASLSVVVGWFYSTTNPVGSPMWNGGGAKVPSYPSSGFQNSTFIAPSPAAAVGGGAPEIRSTELITVGAAIAVVLVSTVIVALALSGGRRPRGRR